MRLHRSFTSSDIVCCVNQSCLYQDLLEVSAEDGLRPKEIYTHPHGCIELYLIVFMAQACNERLIHLRVKVLSQVVLDQISSLRTIEFWQFVIHDDQLVGALVPFHELLYSIDGILTVCDSITLQLECLYDTFKSLQAVHITIYQKDFFKFKTQLFRWSQVSPLNTNILRYLE